MYILILINYTLSSQFQLITMQRRPGMIIWSACKKLSAGVWQFFILYYPTISWNNMICISSIADWWYCLCLSDIHLAMVSTWETSHSHQTLWCLWNTSQRISCWLNSTRVRISKTFSKYVKKKIKKQTNTRTSAESSQYNNNNNNI